jgi:recombination DNA repair RAD52 pathway protein
MVDIFSIAQDRQYTFNEFKEFLSNATISQKNLCSMPLNLEAVTKRKKTESLELDYLEGHYVKRVLTFVFGSKWNSRIVTKESFNDKGGKNDSFFSGCSVVCELSVEWENGDKNTYVDVGHGQGLSKYSALEALESAEKEAVTDALKRAAVPLGDPFGLVLYNKEKLNNPHRFGAFSYGLYDARLKEINNINKDLSVLTGRFLLKVLNKRSKEDISEPHELVVAVKVCEFIIKLVSLNIISLPK